MLPGKGCGRGGDVGNPEKTTNPGNLEGAAVTERVAEVTGEGLADVIAYAVNEEKTRRRRKAGDAKSAGSADEELADEGQPLMQQYVSGINCTPATARMEMTAVKKRYGKNEGVMAFHGYQSFAPGECTPAMAHEIGLELAEELWGNRFQVLVATHLDKAHHLHNHFVVNSVSFTDGLRYHRTNQNYRDMRKVSDRLCREYGLSVVEKKEGRTKHYSEWRAEQEGKPTYMGLIRADVEISKARTEKQFYHYLQEKGYAIKFGKDITVRAAGRERGLKLARNFGEEYTIEAIRRRILLQTKSMQGNEYKTMPEKDSTQMLPMGRKPKVYIAKAYQNPRRRKRVRGLRRLYLRYCYRLGILPKYTKNRSAKSLGEVHILLREDLIRLNTISKETRLLCHYRIDTVEQLFSLKEGLQTQMEELVKQRKSLRSKSRRIHEEAKLSEVKEEISEMTREIGTIRKELTLCDGIAARSGAVREKLDTIRQEQSKMKEKNEHEHIRRGR